MHLPRPRAVATFVLTTAVVGLAACSDGHSPLGIGTAVSPAISLQPSSQPANRRLARLFAFALRDSGVRADVKEALASSPVVSDKLFLSTYLRGKGAHARAAMAHAGGVSQASILNLLTEIGPLELYFPVDAHRTEWT